jgi:hypothetical protein
VLFHLFFPRSTISPPIFTTSCDWYKKFTPQLLTAQSVTAIDSGKIHTLIQHGKKYTTFQLRKSYTGFTLSFFAHPPASPQKFTGKILT